MRFFLVVLVLSLTLLCQAWGKHLLIETEDDNGGENEEPFGDDDSGDDHWRGVQAAYNRDRKGDKCGITKPCEKCKKKECKKASNCDWKQKDCKGSSHRLTWTTNSSLTLLIGGKKRTIVLTPTTNIPGLNTPCLFKGRLEGDSSSVVSVSGCPDTDTLVSISTSLLRGVLDLSLTVAGIAKNIVAETVTDKSNEEVPNDYLVAPPEKGATKSAVWEGEMPSKVFLRTNIGYDNSLLKHFRNSHKKTKDWINKVVELTKPRLAHKSLGMVVDLKIGEVGHIDETIEASEKDIEFLKDKRYRSLTSFFCKDIGRGITGLAYIGEACRKDGYAININELYSLVHSELKTANFFAHELGHNIGMRHDFNEAHGGEGGKCDKKGIMSYGELKRIRWSRCSHNDFRHWWKEKGHRCVPNKEEKISMIRSVPDVCIEANVNYVLNDIKDIRNIDSAEACACICNEQYITETTEQDRVSTFSWNKKERRCWLKRSKDLGPLGFLVKFIKDGLNMSDGYYSGSNECCPDARFTCRTDRECFQEDKICFGLRLCKCEDGRCIRKGAVMSA